MSENINGYLKKINYNMNLRQKIVRMDKENKINNYMLYFNFEIKIIIKKQQKESNSVRTMLPNKS